MFGVSSGWEGGREEGSEQANLSREIPGLQKKKKKKKEKPAVASKRKTTREMEERRFQSRGMPTEEEEEEEEADWPIIQGFLASPSVIAASSPSYLSPQICSQGCQAFGGWYSQAAMSPSLNGATNLIDLKKVGYKCIFIYNPQDANAIIYNQNGYPCGNPVCSGIFLSFHQRRRKTNERNNLSRSFPTKQKRWCDKKNLFGKKIISFSSADIATNLMKSTSKEKRRKKIDFIPTGRSLISSAKRENWHSA